MKHLEKIAAEYAQKNFRIIKGFDNGDEAIKHDIAYHAFCDGFNEAMRILMAIGNIEHLDERINEFNFIKMEE